eukprot:m.135844 g.135844  ORF g.135844 m.135844 type:complete len:557 (-) comp14716_c0_seq24:1072-2742(-)
MCIFCMRQLDPELVNRLENNQYSTVVKGHLSEDEVRTLLTKDIAAVEGMNEDDIEDLRFRERLTRAANLFDLSVAIHGYGDSEFALQGITKAFILLDDEVDEDSPPDAKKLKDAIVSEKTSYELFSIISIDDEKLKCLPIHERLENAKKLHAKAISADELTMENKDSTRLQLLNIASRYLFVNEKGDNSEKIQLKRNTEGSFGVGFSLAEGLVCVAPSASIDDRLVGARVEKVNGEKYEDLVEIYKLLKEFTEDSLTIEVRCIGEEFGGNNEKIAKTIEEIKKLKSKIDETTASIFSGDFEGTVDNSEQETEIRRLSLSLWQGSNKHDNLNSILEQMCALLLISEEDSLKAICDGHLDPVLIYISAKSTLLFPALDVVGACIGILEPETLGAAEPKVTSAVAKLFSSLITYLRTLLQSKLEVAALCKTMRCVICLLEKCKELESLVAMKPLLDSVWATTCAPADCFECRLEFVFVKGKDPVDDKKKPPLLIASVTPLLKSPNTDIFNLTTEIIDILSGMQCPSPFSARHLKSAYDSVKRMRKKKEAYHRATSGFAY